MTVPFLAHISYGQGRRNAWSKQQSHKLKNKKTVSSSTRLIKSNPYKKRSHERVKLPHQEGKLSAKAELRKREKGQWSRIHLQLHSWSQSICTKLLVTNDRNRVIKPWERNELTHTKARALVYFASNDRFKTSAESWLVTITMVADRAAPKTRSLTRVVMILLILAMKVKLHWVYSKECKAPLGGKFKRKTIEDTYGLTAQVCMC